MMYFGNIVTAATSAAAATSSDTTAASAGVILVEFLPLIAIFVLLYFIMIRPQRKKEKKTQQMRDALQVGDNVTTVGGIVGRVVSIKEDAVVIETGADRNKMLIKKWSIQSVETLHDDVG
jgi:preprotein translocase subunit YajC